jgi:hypothetical protein
VTQVLFKQKVQGPVHVPQSSVPPHSLDTMPHVAPSTAHVAGAHPLVLEELDAEVLEELDAEVLEELAVEVLEELVVEVLEELVVGGWLVVEAPPAPAEPEPVLTTTVLVHVASPRSSADAPSNEGSVER